ncbi:MAG: T9SS type A sorting domain-containing protein [Bacteroidetes bacterium]|nr:T9SS type A sorting domain-containing protein [Bacteroidota bacterium]
MKTFTRLLLNVNRVWHKSLALPFVLLLTFSQSALPQCTAGYNQVTLNWDYLDFLIYTANYTSGNGYLSGVGVAQTQYFAFGPQRLTIAHNYAAANFAGENSTKTGGTADVGTYGAGHQNVQFTGNGQITLTFENEVRNLKFSLLDADASQRFQFTALNASSAAQTVTLTTFAGTVLTVTNNNTTNARTDAAATNAATAAVTANFNVDIPGPVKTVTITVSNTTTSGSDVGQFWLSNIIACSPGSFTSNYYQVSKPFTNQPGYILHAFDKSVYYVNPATGVTKFLFTDAAGPGNINSMAYDPYNKILYYVYSLTGDAANNHKLMKYDVTTKTISTVLADVNTIGIPTTDYVGVESGAAAFYDGKLYLGIETNNSGQNSGREAVIWRIDFTGTTPTRASQVYAMPMDDGAGTLIHDWADFTIFNGVLYDFDGALPTSTPTQTDIYQYDLMTGTATNYNRPAGYIPGQPAVDWNGKIWQLYAYSGTSTAPYIAPYNGDGTIGAHQLITSSPAYTPAIPSLGDAAEAFKPMADYGDAPATYDPSAGDPAVHEYDPNLRLGSTWDDEWATAPSATANGDGADEDGIAVLPVLNYLGMTTYTVNVKVYNNTGANATLAVWLDYNFNGTFEPAEGKIITVATNAAVQTIPVTWTVGVGSPGAAIRTFLRARVSSTAMTTSSINGWMANGEVEDYPVALGALLPEEILSFTAEKKDHQQVKLQWSIADASKVAHFEVERSKDGTNWNTLSTVPATTVSGIYNAIFSYADVNATGGQSFYHVKLVFNDGTISYTDIKSVNFASGNAITGISPNPAVDYTKLTFHSEAKAPATVQITDLSGKQLMVKTVTATPGDNIVTLTDLSNFPAGLYFVRVNLAGTISNQKLLISRN